MRLGLASIQRDRNPWIVEWLAFHMLMGFERFYLYAHKTRDGMTETLLRLARHYPIQVHALEDDQQPQLRAYQHAHTAYGAEVDWMAYLDGDEFLQAPNHDRVSDALVHFDALPLSAVGAYWMHHGSNGHVDEPGGLIVEQYPRHAHEHFEINRHVKSIVRGSEPVQVLGAHVFQTPRGTYDEQGRLLTHGFMPQYAPGYQWLRINHYSVQSWAYFKATKQRSGAPDADPGLVRPDSWFFKHDRNECDDGSSYRFLVPLKLKVRELEQALAAS
ncbi:MAG: glycosyltransferase family 2 protein [Burkholderiales bacterium]